MRFELAECRETRSHGHWVSAQRARLVNGPHGCDLFHQVAAACECADGKATADHLAVSYEVGFHAESLSHATQRDAKAADDFIEDDQRAVRVGEFHEFLEELRTLRQQAKVCGQGLDDHSSDAAAVASEYLLQRR